MPQAQLPDPITSKDWLVYVGLPAGGAILGHAWMRFRRRLTVLRWTSNHQPMAFGTHDFGWGKVDILYNGQPAGNLHITTARIYNDTQVDFKDLEIQCQLTEGTLVLRSIAQVSGALDALPFAPGYARILAEASKRPLSQAELNLWGRRSDWTVPVLNRLGTIDVRFLLARADHEAPVLTIHCNHVGVRLRHEPPAQQIWGINQNRAALVGLIAGFGVVVGAVKLGAATWGGAASPWLVGAVGGLIGAAVIRAWRWLSRMAS